MWLLAPVLIVLQLAIGVAVGSSDVWGQFGCAAGHASASQFVGPVKATSALDCVTTNLPCPTMVYGVFDDANLLFASCFSEVVIAMNTSDVNSMELWSTRVPGSANQFVAVADGRAFVYSTVGGVTALETSTGAVLWQEYASDAAFTDSSGSTPFTTIPVLHNDTVYTGSSYGIVLALRASDGAFKWRADVSGGTVPCETSLPAVDASTDSILVGCADTLYSLEAASGEERWQAGLPVLNSTWSTHADVKFLVSVASSGVAAVTLNSSVYAVNSTSGGLLWTNTPSMPLMSPVAFSRTGVALFTSASRQQNSGSILAVNATSGAELWTHNLRGSVPSWPTVDSSDTVFASVSSFTGLLALNATSGAVLWTNTYVEAPQSVDAYVMLNSDGVALVNSLYNVEQTVCFVSGARPGQTSPSPSPSPVSPSPSASTSHSSSRTGSASVTPSLAPSANATSHTVLYIAPAGIDTGDCAVAATPCRTLRYAVNAVAEFIYPTTVEVSVVVAPGLYTTTSCGAVSSRPLAVLGSASMPLFDCGSEARLLDTSASVRVSGISVVNAVASDGAGGGAVLARPALPSGMVLVMDHVSLSNCSSDGPGGAVAVSIVGATVANVSVSLHNVSVTGCSSNGAGDTADVVFFRCVCRVLRCTGFEPCVRVMLWQVVACRLRCLHPRPCPTCHSKCSSCTLRAILLPAA